MTIALIPNNGDDEHRRRATGETVAPYRHRRDRPALRTLAQELTGWLRAHIKTLEQAAPAMPVEDRAADTWEPLVAVADLAGGPWPARARAAVVQLVDEATEKSETSDRIRLLLDIHTAFAGLDAIPTALLLQRLKADPETPWLDYGHNGLTPKKLGDLLKEYDIGSHTIRFPVSGIRTGEGLSAVGFPRRLAPLLPAPGRPSQHGRPARRAARWRLGRDERATVGEGYPYYPYQPHQCRSERCGSHLVRIDPYQA